MLEVGIIICLALVMFLALRNFPKTLELKEAMSENKPKKESFLKKIFHRPTKDKAVEIQEAIAEGQIGIIAPSETEAAKNKYKEEDPEIAQLLYEAEKALEKSDLRAAEDLAIDVLSREKRCANAYEVIGRVAMLRGSFPEAKEAFKTSIKCDRELAEGYFGLGLIELRSENYTEAIESLQRSVTLDRGHADWYAELGQAYMQVRQFAKAAKALKRATSLDIDNKKYKELAAEAEEKQRAHATAFRGK